MDLLIERGTLSSGAMSDIAISGGRIAALHPPGTGRSPGRAVDADGRLVLPGLVNPHTHLDKAQLGSSVRNVSGTVQEARQRMRDAKAGFTVDDIRRRASAVLERCVTRGVTAMRSHVDVDPILGLKGVEALVSLRESMSDLIDIQLVAFPQEGIEQQPGTIELLREALRMGVDVVGGHLSIGRDPDAMRRETDAVFELAMEFDRDIDVHVDHSIDKDYAAAVSQHPDGKTYPDELGVVYLAEKTIRERYQGRVTASHVCGLDALPPALRSNVIDLLLRADVAVIALPASNLYTNGRADPFNLRRGVTTLRELRAAGIRVAVGTDNIRDAFSPFVSGDLIQNAIVAALACHLVTSADIRWMLDLETVAAARLMGLDEYGLEHDCRADLVVLSARSWDDLLDGEATCDLVLKGGRTVATTTVSRATYRTMAQ